MQLRYWASPLMRFRHPLLYTHLLNKKFNAFDCFDRIKIKPNHLILDSKKILVHRKPALMRALRNTSPPLDPSKIHERVGVLPPPSNSSRRRLSRVSVGKFRVHQGEKPGAKSRAARGERCHCSPRGRASGRLGTHTLKISSRSLSSRQQRLLGFATSLPLRLTSLPWISRLAARNSARDNRLSLTHPGAGKTKEQKRV